MSNSPLEDFEPLDVLVATIAPECGISTRDLCDLILAGVTSSAVRFSEDGGEPLEWSQSRYPSRPAVHRPRPAKETWSFGLGNVGNFDVHNLDFRAKPSRGWDEVTPLGRFREAASPGGAIQIETLSALAFLERNGLAVASVREALSSSVSKEPRAGSRRGPRPIAGLRQHLFLHLVDNGRPETKEALVDEARAFCVRRGIGKDARSTLLPYVDEALRDYEEHLATRVEG